MFKKKIVIFLTLVIWFFLFCFTIPVLAESGGPDCSTFNSVRCSDDSNCKPIPCYCFGSSDAVYCRQNPGSTVPAFCGNIETNGLGNCKARADVGVACTKNVDCIENKCIDNACVSSKTNESTIKWQPLAPTLQINIPTVPLFTTSDISKTDSAGYIFIPFIGQYLSGIYKWALAVAGIICGILIIIGGFIYMTAGGNAERVKQGTERITHALFGLFLLLGSYTILYVINPDLVQLKSLKIKVIERDELAEFVFPTNEDNTPQNAGARDFGSTTEFDAVFQKYASCAGLNWELYKAIAQHESGLHADIKNPNSSATGLFQAMAGKDNATCKAVLKKIGWSDKCDSPGLKDPEVNTAYATLIFKSSVPMIKSKCSSASFEDKVFMLYFGHGSGPGALKEGIRQFGCAPFTNSSTWPDSTWPAGTAYGLTGIKIFRGASLTYTKQIVQKIAGFKITKFEGPTGSCPLR